MKLIQELFKSATRRWHAETALRESEERFRDFAEISSDWFWEMDEELRFTYFSERYQQATGFEPACRIGKKRSEFVPRIELEANPEKWAAHFADLDSRRPFRDFEYISSATLGNVRHVRVSGMPIFDDQGVFLGYRGTGTDITDRKLAEEKLRESEELLRQITENVQAVFWVTDPEKNQMLYISPAYEKIWGLTRESLSREPRSFLDAIHPEDRDCVVAAMPRQVFGDYDEEYRVVQPNGDIRWVRDRAFPIQDDTGKTFRVAGITADITDRKLAEEALRDSEDRYRQLTELSPEGIMVHTDGKITFANDGLARIFGAESPDRLIGLRALDLAAPEEHENILERRKMADAGRVVFLEEAKFLRLDGSITHAERAVAPMIWHDKPSYLVIFRDVNERLRTEEQLRQAQKMEAVGQLTGGVAHDFNNLLTVVLGNLQLLSDRIPDDEIGRDYIDSAVSGARRGAELTHRLLAFSRRQALVPVVLDPSALIDGLLDLMRRTLGETIEIDVSGDADLWRCVADPAQLENAILNLAINARDAMPDGGKLTIEAGNASLDDDYAAAQVEMEPGEYVVLSVTDTGTGIPAEAIDHVFEPFFTTKEVGAGSGLGLSMVYGFAKQSGGHVTIYSEDDVGTTVNIYLPRSVAGADEALQGELEPEPRARGETVLVVEDDADVRTLTVALLSDLGYGIVEASDGAAALAALDHAPGINLLFTDVVLPGGMSGPDLATDVMRRRPGISVLFTSGYANDSTIRRGLVDGGFDLLNKPFRKADLARRVRSTLDRANA